MSSLSLSSKSIGAVQLPGPQKTAAADGPAADELLTMVLEHGTVVLPHGQMLRNAAELEELHDVAFQLGKKELVLAHQFVVAVRYPCLLECWTAAATSKSRSGVTVYAAAKDWPFSAAALRELLVWVYTGSLDPAVSLATLREIAAGVDALGGPFVTSPLLYELEHCARRHLTAAAERLHDAVLVLQPPGGGAACERLRLLLHAYLFRDWTAFLEEKEGLRKLGIELVQALSSAKAASDPGAVATLLEGSPRPPSQILEHYRTAFVARVHTDATLVSAEGEAVECHRALLACWWPRCRPPGRNSPRTKESAPGASPRRGTAGEMVSPRGKGERGKVALDLGVRLPSAALRAMLQFCYAGVVTFTCQDSLALLPLLGQAPGLLPAVVPALARLTAASAIEVLAATYGPDTAAHPAVFGLRKSALQFVVEHFRTLDLVPLLAADPRVRCDLLFALQRHLILTDPK